MYIITISISPYKKEYKMLVNYFRNKKMNKLYGENSCGFTSDGSYIEDVLVKAKDQNIYLIRHIQYADENKELTTFGIYRIFNNKDKPIGYLKYVLNDKDKNDVHMILCDIHFDFSYRNIGLGSKTLNLFEKRAKIYGAQYITGKLGDVDEQTLYEKALRDTFYLKSGYEIVNSKEIHKELV